MARPARSPLRSMDVHRIFDERSTAVRRGSAVGVAAVADAVDGDGVFRLVENHAVVAHAKPQ
jgi:hypothetical protein